MSPCAMLTPADGGRGPAIGAAGRSWCGRKAGYSVVFRGRTWRWASAMAVGMAVATMGRDASFNPTVHVVPTLALV